MKKKFLSILTAIAVIISLSACQAEDTEQAPLLSEATVSETTQVEITTQKSETTVTEILEETQAEENVQTDIYITENTDENIETVVIANQEFPINIKHVEIKLTDDSSLVTDISEIGKLKNLEYLSINNISDGGPYAIDGLEAIAGCTTITSISICADLADKEDICILETLPNLKTLDIYGVSSYNAWDFNLKAIEDLTLIGTIDLSKIEHLTSLKSLYIEYNNSTDLTPIEKLENLESLQIWESKFNDYSSILALKNLKGLYICSTPMSEEMYDKIVEKLFNCKITVTNLLAE